VYRWTNGSLTRIARTGQANSGSFFDGFSWPSLNEAGDVAFVGFLDADDQGIYRRRGAQLTRIAFTGDESPAGWIIEDFSPVAGVAINEAGQVAFRAIVDPPFCCGRDDVIYLGDGGALTRLAFSGQAVPGGGFVPQAINRNLALNNRGQVVFAGSTSNGNSAIYRAEAGRILRIAYEDGPVPGSPSQTFTNLAGFDFAINDRGHVAFTARFDNGSDAVLGLFLYIDGTGLVRIIEEDVPFLGSFVDTVNFVGTNPSDWRAREPTGLDARGNVAFRFRLSDGRQGVAVYQNRVIFADDFESGNVDRWSL
ncbi:MAG: choice-of-anchor tandem repeat NxxGxxAF-containing protein, partial [Acidobacteriota bacterium]